MLNLFRRRKPEDQPPPPSDNPIHRLLEAAQIPWRTPRRDLARRLGVRRDPAYDWEVLEFPADPPLLTGMIRPFTAQVSDLHVPDAPPTEFSALVWHGPDARENLRRAADEIADRLGPTRVGDAANTIEALWTHPPASLRLLAWPEDLQTFPMGPDPAHDRDPRLAQACHVMIASGWRRPLSDQERAWTASFEPISDIPLDRGWTPQRLRNAPAAESELDYVREPDDALPQIFGRIGRSADGAALLMAARQLYVVGREQLRGFELIRTLPAKGPGGSQLNLVCRGNRILVGSADGPEDLTPLANHLPQAFSVPLRTPEPDYDV